MTDTDNSIQVTNLNSLTFDIKFGENGVSVGVTKLSRGFYVTCNGYHAQASTIKEAFEKLSQILIEVSKEDIEFVPNFFNVIEMCNLYFGQK